MLRQRIRRLDIPLWARNRALHYLVGSYRLSDELRRQLIEVINGYTGPWDEDAARKGMEWMREQYRERGETPRF
jgi:hypothetical protein